MDNSYKPDLITLIDEDNVEHNFEILDTIENEKGVFYALYPIYDNAKDSVDDSGEYYIMEVIEEDGEEQLAEVQDEALLSRKKTRKRNNKRLLLVKGAVSAS